MNPALALVAAPCTLLGASVDLDRVDGVWVEKITLEVSGDRRCDEVAIALDADDTATPGKVRMKMWDDTARTLEPTRWRLLDRDDEGAGALVLDVPDLGAGDRVVLHAIRRRQSVETWRWQPTARFSELRWRGEGALSGTAVELDREAGVAWVGDPTPAAEMRVLQPVVTHQGLLDEAGDALPRGLPVGAALARTGHLVIVDVDVALFGGAAPAVWAELLSRRGWLTPEEWVWWLVLCTRDGEEALEAGWWLPQEAPPGDLRGSRWPVAIRGDDVWVPPGLELPAGRAVRADGTRVETAVLHHLDGGEEGDGVVDIHRDLVLAVPVGDVQRALFPGGGSRYATRDTIDFPAGAVQRWTVTPPLGAGAPELLAAEGVTAVVRADHVVLISDALAQAPQATVGWAAPDAPTFGEPPQLPGARVTQTVSGPGLSIEQDPAGPWVLREAHGDPVIPDTDSLLFSLERRFGYLSMPEPGLPMEYKFQAASPESLGRLSDALYVRAVPVDVPHPPLWPRPLKKARGTGYVSPLEAALIVTRYAQQLRARTEWVLVRPATNGPGAAGSPAGFTDALVKVGIGGEVRWLDPGCRWCGPGEIRPDLTGADALSWTETHSPPPQPGTLRVTRTDESITLTATGSAALTWRTEAATIPDAERDQALGAVVGGPDAALQRAEGLPDRGAALTLVTDSDVSRVGLDPLALPEADADGSTWVGWLGLRRWEGARVPPMPMDVRLGAGVRYRRQVDDDGVVTEDLWLTKRRLDPKMRLRLERLRRPAPVPL